MKILTVSMFILIIWLSSGVVFDYFNSPKSYNKGFEAGKNYVPPSMHRADSLSVVYYGNKPMVSDQIKMPRDSVQLIIDGVMGKPKQYLLMTLKLVTKEKE